jgi:hypothetical protein
MNRSNVGISELGSDMVIGMMTDLLSGTSLAGERKPAAGDRAGRPSR